MQGSGVQVVEVVENGTYRLDVEALKSILLKDQVKDLPVAVVSVAGAYRGGKSFILNFFLRYIQAPRSKQLDGTWLGEDNAPLEGFSWRGGSARNTTGIVIWSEPFVATLENGQKVAVILMDTQGTFDNSSTFRDCTTIFALSTLLSSIQIYNLKENIREDDLQHLHLFTEYGNLIKERDSKAFQTLEFLIRDWPNAAEFSYGSSGGNLYMQDILQVKPKMDKELRVLRQHILASFKMVSCFLMPHPGLEVRKADFKGQTCVMTPEFKEYVSQLTSHIFGPARLKPKEISGDVVTATSLFTYFTTYLKVFNSGDMPTPTSIIQATAKAGLLSTYEEARRTYERGMESNCGPSRPSLPAHDLYNLHQNYIEEAVTVFTNKKKICYEYSAEEYLEILEEELEQRLGQFVELNIGKIQKTIIEAKELYESKTGQIKNEQMLCVHPFDLKEIHMNALQAAIEHFDKNRRTISENKEDKDRIGFVKNFEKQYELLKHINDQNNKMIVTELRLEYWQTMERKCSNEVLSKSQLEQEHEEALAKALESFSSKRNHPDCYDTDEYKTSLKELIENCFIQMTGLNQSKNKAALQSAFKAYDEHMASAWDPKKVCLHPGDLAKENEAAEWKAMVQFRPSREEEYVFFDPDDEDEIILGEFVEGRFKEIKENNDSANATAVTVAVNLYSEEMLLNCGFSIWWVVGIGIPYLVNKYRRGDYHKASKNKAFEEFYKKRRPFLGTAPDEFFDDLKSKIDAVKREYY